MPIAVAFLEVPDAPGRVVQQGDVQQGEGNSITIQLNRGGDIIEQQLAKRTITFSVKGLTGLEIGTLRTLADNNLLALLAGNNPTIQSIGFSGITYPDCFLRTVNPSGSVNVGGFDVVENCELVYETLGRYLI